MHLLMVAAVFAACVCAHVLQDCLFAHSCGVQLALCKCFAALDAGRCRGEEWLIVITLS